MGLILMIVVILLLVGGLPSWSYGRRWGYRPGGVLAPVLLFLVVLVLAVYVPRRF